MLGSSTIEPDAPAQTMSITSAIPADPYLLDADDFALVKERCLERWPSLAAESRDRILTRLRKEEATRRARDERRKDRQDKSAAYVAALCSLPKPHEDGYAQAWQDMLEKKAAYLQVKSAR